MDNNSLVWFAVLISINFWVLLFFMGEVINELTAIRRVLTIGVKEMPTREMIEILSDEHLRKETR